MQAMVAKFILNKNGGSIPVCTERKATGLFVLTNFLCDNDTKVRKHLMILMKSRVTTSVSY